MDQIIDLEPSPQAPGAAGGLAVVRSGGEVARCMLWTRQTPGYQGKPVGVIGAYAAEDEQAGVALLKAAVRRLGERGFELVVGPMDGSTWRRYRMVTNRGSEPPFFLEPDNPDDWPDHFQAAGFMPLARYCSGLNEDLTITDPRVPEAMRRLADAGIAIRTIDMRRYEEELLAIHALSLEAFAGNFLYTPISAEQFLAMFAPLRAHIQPQMVLLAEQEGTLVGFAFGIPNLKQAERGEAIDTAIAKTIAVRPGRSGAGLGSVLLDQLQQAARRLGYRRMIHALMHENNRSRQMTARFGRPFRQYTLYARSIR